MKAGELWNILKYKEDLLDVVISFGESSDELHHIVKVEEDVAIRRLVITASWRPKESRKVFEEFENSDLKEKTLNFKRLLDKTGYKYELDPSSEGDHYSF